MASNFKILFFFLTLFYSCNYKSNETVSISIDTQTPIGEMTPIWSYFGHDEPNYTYMPDGMKLLNDLDELSTIPLRIRTHNLLTTDVGVPPNLKWGFTNAYTEDENGIPIYDWTLIDSIFDLYIVYNIDPLVEIGFMPKALSTHPEPYAHDWANKGEIWTGWSYPPNDYDKWEELIYQWVKHSVERYGLKEVNQWLWQVWNEPNIGYWSGTFEEYLMLYDYAANGLKRACPTCVIGGPHTTNPSGETALNYLQGFLEHCISGTNYATSEIGSPVEFVAFHAKGSPEIDGDHIRMDMSNQLKSISNGFEIVGSFPELKGIPIIIGENDPEGCAACSYIRDPKYDYRNGTVYPSYTASQFAKIFELKDKHNVNLIGALSWAFEFEGQEWFGGFRDLATNGVNKPILNLFRMYAKMSGERLSVKSTSQKLVDDVIENKILGDPDIGALASKNGSQIAIMVWNYHDDDILEESSSVDLNITGLDSENFTLKHYRLDQKYSNSFEAYKAMGSPKEVTQQQRAILDEASTLKEIHPITNIKAENGNAKVTFDLPRQGVSLLVFQEIM